MSPGLADLMGRFRGRRVVVLGEAMLDAYLHGRVDRLAREAPVPVLGVERTLDAPGGAANTAANIAALGGDVTLVAVVGADDPGDRLRRALSACGVGVAGLVTDPSRATLAKQRLVSMDQLLLRVDTGSTDPLPRTVEDGLVTALRAPLDRADAVVVSDYGYGVLTPRVLDALERHRRPDRPLVVDARDLRRFRHLRPTLVKPNYAEAVRLLGLPEERDPKRRRLQVLPAGARLLELTGAAAVALTVDQDGAFVFEPGLDPYRTYARPRSHARASGAGDTFVAAAALALAGGAAPTLAAELASAAAAVVVGKDGTSTCSPPELSAFLGLGAKRLADEAATVARVEYERRQGRRIVFTNGCFDILHRGHVTYLNRAKTLGDVLIVAVNSDDGVRRLKGPSRPINPLDDRLGVLEALSCVDHVVAFDEPTPSRLIELVRPDVYVKGGDYRPETLPEAPLVEALGGSVQILPFVPDRSTTAIVERARALGAPVEGAS